MRNTMPGAYTTVPVTFAAMAVTLPESPVTFDRNTQWEEMHVWLQLERMRVPDGSGIAAAIDYSLNHWDALTEHLSNGNVAADNNHCENQMRPWALGRKSWLFAGSELAGQRAGVVMSLTQSAKLNGHDPWAYLKDVLERLPTQPNSRIEELLPHRWKPLA